jgi:sphingolipid delta-4 desaturase
MAPASAASAASGFDFEWSLTAEPHMTRRKAILAAHPEVRALYGADPWLKWQALAAVAVQLGACYVARDMSWPSVLLLAYALGGVVNHSMTLCMHEISHNLAFDTKSWAARLLGFSNANRIVGIVANLPLGIPSSVSFRRYHMEHHNYQGEDGIDADIPTKVEGAVFRSAPAKFVWLLLQPAFYAIRPLIVVRAGAVNASINGKAFSSHLDRSPSAALLAPSSPPQLPKTPGVWELVNFAAQLAFDALVFRLGGWRGLAYLVLGTLLGMGAHPMAGHFVAEHYTFDKAPSALGGGAPQETFSYYGPLNWLSFNVGYHNEHHDFPFIPGSRLPKLRELAPEFYEAPVVRHHSSWVAVLLNYVLRGNVGPLARVKRKTLSEEALADFRRESAGGNEACAT